MVATAARARCGEGNCRDGFGEDGWLTRRELVTKCNQKEKPLESSGPRART
jgi:hypothetical protein